MSTLTSTAPSQPAVAHEAPEVPARPAPLPSEVLADIAAGVAAAEAWWRPHAHHDPAGRRPVRLLATEAYEVWVIGWTTGQGVELHDHGDAAGVLVVVEGGLAELTYEPTTGALAHRAITPGTVHPLPEGLVHDVVAAAPVATTSIHVYSPPLASMRRWDPVTLEPDAAEAVVPLVSALASDAVGRVLHPAAARRG